MRGSSSHQKCELLIDIMKSAPKLSKRLATVASFVRDGIRVADIGTDHCLLPIYLIMNNKISFAIASDINEKPLERASINVKKYNLSDKISLVCTNGLENIGNYEPDDILICGMGGDLIKEILSNANSCNIKNQNIRLIIQPMTHLYELRLYLLKNGFKIVDETTIKDDKFYQIIVAEYSGKSTDLSFGISESELLLGKANMLNPTPIFIEYINYLYNIWLARKKGKETAGQNTDYETIMLNDFDKLKKGNYYDSQRII